MKSSQCLYHCALFLITLTFNTIPTLSLTSVMVKLNQSALLPCELNCSGSFKWMVTDDPQTVVARCDQTSCSLTDGFYISHDQYMKNNLSLIINIADYTKRNTYTCLCDGDEIINIVRLSIEPRTLFINLQIGKNLVLNLHMSGPTVVTYRSKDSPDQYGEVICTVDKEVLECKSGYKTRVSLTHSKLILKKITMSECGVYTVWDKKNNEINLNYFVTVKEPLVDRVKVKLHESVSLFCNVSCPGLGKWTLLDRGVVGWCNQRSCWSDKGYEISHSNYLKGNFSLSITSDDYSMRGLYTCTCEDMDILDYSVVIEPKLSLVKIKPGEDLLMDLPLTEPVSVIYGHSMVLADDTAAEDICTVEKVSLVCIDAYTQKISAVLKLRNVNLTDSGVYTIQSTKSQEEFIIYNVSVQDEQPMADRELCFPHLTLGLGLTAVGALALFIVCVYLMCKKKSSSD